MPPKKRKAETPAGEDPGLVPAAVLKVRTRCCALGHTTFANLGEQAPRVRHLLDREVVAVSKAMREGSKFLSLQLRLVLQASGGRLAPDFPLKQACRQAFAAMQANARPHTTTPGYVQAMDKWRALRPANHQGARLFAPNSLTYESNAYFSTLMSNFTKIALPAHVFWALRYLWPWHRPALKKAIVERQEDALDGLPLAALPIIAECQAIQDADFTEELAVRAVNLRWTCLGMVDALGPAHHVLGAEGQCVVHHPKRFHLVPQCRRAARFVTLDKQWARLALGLKIKPGPQDPAFPDDNLLRYLLSANANVRKWCRNPKFIFPSTVRTDGVQLHIPFEMLVPEGEPSDVKDWRRRDPEALAAQLASARPHGLFHIEAGRLLDADHPSCTNSVGVDPGVKNLVTTNTGVKITRQQFYGERRPRKVFDPGTGTGTAGARSGPHSRATRENRVPESIDRQQRSLCLGTRAEGQDLGRFEVNLTAWLRCAEALQTYYGSRTQRSIRLVQGGKKRANMASVVSAIAPDPRTVVVFGANFFGRACRTGDVAGPVVVKGIRRALAKERVVILADEFNSTKCHAVCGSVMRRHPDDPHEKWCDTCGCAVDRDGNAATNIHSVWPRYLLDGQRPEHLRRVPHGRLQALV
jgi:hypothetical protein